MSKFSPAKSLSNQRIKLFTFLFLFSILLAAQSLTATAKIRNPHSRRAPRLLFLPLDERFATRDLFLSLSKITDFEVLTPEKSKLPNKKLAPDMNYLIEWTRKTAKEAYFAVISADMLLYGGLIASRTSLDSAGQIRARLKTLETIRRENPKLPIYVSSTVMRMPSYPSAEEEPDYYAAYGRQIFLYSEALHRFEVLKNPRDQKISEEQKNLIPAEVLRDYLMRRTRNFEINRQLIRLVRENVINRLVITLDDNAEYGLFKKEAAELAQDSANLRDKIAIYPGADEAQLPLLARFALGKKRLKFFVAYRFPESKRLIPSFEGQPLEDSIKQQIAASGGVSVNSSENADCVLFVNNFKEKNIFPPKNSFKPMGDVAPLEEWLANAGITNSARQTLILADNNYYNGADGNFVAAIFKGNIAPLRIAYAGWNTSGNTLGSAIAMGVLKHEMKPSPANREIYKQILWTRFIEDWVYMTEGREMIREDLKKRNLSGFENDSALEENYCEMMKNLFNLRAAHVNRFLQTDLRTSRVFFPWHRSFEVGFEISK